MPAVNNVLVISMWDNDDNHFVTSDAKSRAGGLIWIWDKSVFTLTQSVTGVGYLLIQGEYTSTK